eukprot:1159935-Rhodomonas_salina.2
MRCVVSPGQRTATAVGYVGPAALSRADATSRPDNAYSSSSDSRAIRDVRTGYRAGHSTHAWDHTLHQDHTAHSTRVG